MNTRQWIALGGLAATIAFALYMVLQLDAERTARATPVNTGGSSARVLALQPQAQINFESRRFTLQSSAPSLARYATLSFAANRSTAA
jgi:hypothetical protein